MPLLLPATEMIEGFLLQASLIFALGAQNIFILECGLRRQRPLFVAIICAISDSLLISLGVLGIGSIFASNLWLKILFGILGVIFIFMYGVQKLLERPDIIVNDTIIKTKHVIFLTLKQLFIKTLAFSFLNPHVYLDTLVLIGSYAAEFTAVYERALFGIGAILASWIWFFSLASASIAMSRFFADEKRMRWVLRLSGIILIILGIYLSIEVFHWITLLPK